MPTDLAVRVAGHWHRVATTQPIDLAVPLTEASTDPQFFAAEAARSVPMQSAGFIGDTTAGGSCNVRVWTLNPHCNGTHTESIGHITDDPLAVGELLPATPMVAQLLSVRAAADDRVPATEFADRLHAGADALILRTRGDDETAGAVSRSYPVLAAPAMRLIAGLPLQHLLIDTPSLDTEQDATLSNHRIWWGLASAERLAGAATHPQRTVTEFIYVPPAVSDGVYLLCHGCARWQSDAAPSRPTLYALTRQTDGSAPL